MEFAYDETIGFLNSSLSNVGNGIFFRFKFIVNKEKVNEIVSKLQERSKEINLKITHDGERTFAEFSNYSSFINVASLT